MLAGCVLHYDYDWSGLFLTLVAPEIPLFVARPGTHHGQRAEVSCPELGYLGVTCHVTATTPHIDCMLQTDQRFVVDLTTTPTELHERRSSNSCSRYGQTLPDQRAGNPSRKVIARNGRGHPVRLAWIQRSQRFALRPSHRATPWRPVTRRLHGPYEAFQQWTGTHQTS